MNVEPAILPVDIKVGQVSKPVQSVYVALESYTT